MKTFSTVSRRGMLSSMAVLGLLSATGLGQAASRKQGTFVLVHGAWHGGWCWKRLSPLLRAVGYEVYTPTLTGLGDRAEELAETVDLERHVRDVVNLLYYEDLQNVILVGHSSGGMVIAGVADQVPERLQHLIYLDAFLPEDGKAVKDYAPLRPTRADGWRVPVGDLNFDVRDPSDLDWVRPRWSDQPMRHFTQPLKLSRQEKPTYARSFIRTTTEAAWFNEAGLRAQRMGFTYRELLSAGHDSMITDPAALARILLSLV